jgi:hypothetical protein
MRTLNPTLLRDAIREGMGARKLQGTPAQEQRKLLHQIYTRKIKEFSSVYPFVFGVENGMRSALADHLEGVFGRINWWIVIRDAVRAGTQPSAFTRIQGTPVSQNFLKSVFRVFETMANPNHVRSVEGPDKTDEFFYCLSLGELWNITGAEWRLTRGMFCSDGDLGFKLDLNRFNNTMRLIKDARNELFHCNPIRNRAQIVQACEEILDGLNVHLGDYDADLAAAIYTRIPATVARLRRHHIPAR